MGAVKKPIRKIARAVKSKLRKQAMLYRVVKQKHVVHLVNLLQLLLHHLQPQLNNKKKK